MSHAFNCFVVQVDVGQFDLPFWDRININGKSVILCGYLNFPGLKIHNGLVAAMMTKL